jgi:hypothetical protein
MIDYRAEKARLLEQIDKDPEQKEKIIKDAWAYGPHHLHLFDALDTHEDQSGWLDCPCGCITQVKAKEDFPRADKRLRPLMTEIVADRSVPRISELCTLSSEDLADALDRFIYYQEAADKILGRTL